MTSKKWLLAVLLALAGMAGTLALELEGTTMYLLLLVVVMFNASYGGFFFGISSAAVEAFFAHVFLREAAPAGARDAAIRTILFFGISVGISIWADSQRKLRVSLTNSTNRFRLLMDNVTDYAIIVMDEHATMLDWNAGAKTIIGLSDSDKGRSLQIIFRTEDEKVFWNELHAAETSGHNGDERLHVRKNGSQFWAYGVMTCLRDSNGRIAGYVKILRDLTQQRLAQDERTQLMNELSRTNSVLKRMMATLAHDLRAPLNTILGWTRIIQSGSLQKAVEIDKALQSIERSGRRQLELIEELLDYSRLMAGAIEHTFEHCCLRQILDDALETVRPPALLKSIHIEQAIECEPAIVGNRIALTQVFTNLLSNAVKFTPNGGHIRVRCGLESKWLHVAVTDTGKGIPLDLRSRIFEPFQRGSGSGTGAGLGLAIVREIVEAHGGDVTAESAGEGCGSTFIVKIPIRGGNNGESCIPPSSSII